MNKASEEEEGVKYLTHHHQRRPFVWSFIMKVAAIYDSLLWQFIFIGSIICKFMDISFYYVFIREPSTGMFRYVMNVIYLQNFLMGLILFFKRDVHIYMKDPPTSRLIIIMELFLIIPYAFIYDVTVSDWKLQTAYILSYFTAFRLVHIIVFFYKKSNSVGINHWIYFIIYYLLILIFIQHVVACVWYTQAFPILIAQTGEETWVNTTLFDTDLLKTVYDWYILCYYFAVTTTCNSSFGDIVPQHYRTVLYSILVMCIGFFITTGLLIGSLQSRFVNSSFRRKSMLKIQMYDIRKYLKENILDEDIKHIIESYYNILWKNKDGVSNVKEYLLMLPFPLRSEICYDINISPLLCSVIFRDKPEAFLRAVSNMMKHEFYQPGEMIYLRNVVKAKMVYIVLGNLQILSDEDDESPIISFDAGTCLGENSLVFAQPSKTCVRTACYTELQVLYRKNFLNIIDLFPQHYANIRNSISQRIADCQTLKKQSKQSTVKMNMFKFKGEEKSVIQTLKYKLRGKLAHDHKDKYLSMYRLRDNMSRKKSSIRFARKSFILDPDSLFAIGWEAIVIVVTVFIAIIYPYEISFNREFPDYLIFLSNFLELILVLDVFVILFTAIDKKDVKLVTFNEIIQEQVQHFGFYMDILSALPLEHFCNPENLRYYYLFKLNKLLKSYRVFMLFKRAENMLHSPTLLIRFIKYPIYIITASYWLGTLLFLITCYQPVCDEHGWFFNKLKEEVKNHVDEALTNHEIFISLYFAISIFCSTAFGDILAGNIPDLISVSIGVMAGIFIFSYCTAELGATITSKLGEKTKFQEYLFSVKRFMDEKRLNKHLKDNVIRFFELQWYYDKGRSLEEKPLFYNATRKIQSDLREKDKVELLLDIPVFRDTSFDFLQVLSLAMETIILPPNQILCKVGETIKTIFIVQDGYCIREHESHEYLLKPSSHYGVMPVVLNIKSLATVRTLTHVKLIRIPERLFWKCLTIFPILNKEFQAVADSFEADKEFAKFELEESEEGTDKYPFKKWTMFSLQGSIVNVRSYCTLNSESYTEPFIQKFGFLYFIKYIIPPICLLPDGRLLKFWVTFRFLATVALVYQIPCQQIARSHFTVINNIIFVIDIITYIDLVVMMFVGYYGPKNQLIIHPVKTIFHYLKGKFILDLIFCFPWEYFGKEWYKLGFIKLGQSYRIPQYFEYLKDDVKKKLYYIEICKFFIINTFLAHVWASIMVITSCTYYDPNISESREFVKQSGLFPINESLAYTMLCEDDSWLVTSKYRQLNKPLEVFILSLYFCTNAMTTCGFGDITVEYRKNLVIVIIMMVTGILYFGYMYASVSSHKVDWNSLLSKNQELIKELKYYMVRENVSKIMQRQVIDHLEYVWRRSGGAEPNEILHNLHTTLHEDVILEIYGRILKNVPLFENVGDTFLRTIGKELKERYFHRKEVILRAEDVVNEIFIIYRGKAKILSLLHDEHAFVGAGSIFGNIKTKTRSQTSVTITALNNVDCLCIKTSVFYAVLQKYPAISRNIREKLKAGVDYLTNPQFEQDNDEEFELFKTRTLLRLTSGTKTSTTSLSLESLDTNLKQITQNWFLICLPWKWFRVVIKPNSQLYQIFDGLAVLMTLVTYGSATYQFVFQSFAIQLLILAIITDIFFFVKIFYDMHKTFENHYGEFTVSNRKVLQKYFKSRKIIRAIQIITNLPIPYLTLLIELFSDNAYFHFSVIRLITLFRFVYIYLYYEERKNKLLVNRLLLEVSIATMSGAIVTHTSACFWYLITCPIDSCHEGSWAEKLKQRNMPKWSIYLTCLYYNVEIITTSGTGDILPDVDIVQITYTVVVMLLINCTIGIFIGVIVSAVDSYTATLSNYEYEIQTLGCFLKNEHLSNFQMSKMWKYVLQLWRVSSGRQMPRLILTLPSAIRSDLMYEIYGHHLTESYIFSGSEESFLKQLSCHFKHTVLFPGNYIVQHGDSDKSMYFIHSGEVEILTVHPNLMETVHETLFKGDMFGLIQGLFHGVPHHFAFRAKTTVHIVSLCLNDWEDLLNFFPESKKLVYDRAHAHYTNV